MTAKPEIAISLAIAVASMLIPWGLAALIP